MEYFETIPIYDRWGYRFMDLITEVFRDTLNPITGVYVKDEKILSPREYDEWYSFESDKCKNLDSDLIF